MSLGRFAEAPPGGLTGSEQRGVCWRAPTAEQKKSFSAKSLVRVARGALEDLITTMFPADCRVCQAPLDGLSRVPVCGGCLEAPQPQCGMLCRVCGDAVGFESERMLGSMEHGGPVVCTPCRMAPPPFARAVAFGVYEGELREMLHLLKYEGVRQLGRPLGAMLAGAIEQVAGDLAEDHAVPDEVLVVPVPLFQARRRERGFNQVELLAAEAVRTLRARRLPLQLRVTPEALLRMKATAEQFGLNPRQRRQNLRGAFSVPQPELVRGRDVLLVDDILTTGATARACASVLARAGARRVLVATVARAQAETVAMWDGGPD